MSMLLLSLNGLIAFLSELAMLCIYAWWSLSLKLPLAMRVVVAVVIVAAVITLWSLFFAPKATISLPQPWNAIGEYFLFGLAGVLLYFVGGLQLAAIYLVCSLGSETIGLIWKL